jgi:hypothetical protein
MICRPDKNAVIQRNHAMNTNNAGPQLQIRGRSRPFRSLLVATAAALILTGFIVPRADAFLITYFNFEDSIIQKGPPKVNFLDPAADTVAGGNPGGGIEASTLSFGVTDAGGNTVVSNVQPGNLSATSPGLSGALLNQTALDSDVPPLTGDFGALFVAAGANQFDFIQFSVNTTLFQTLSLSFGVNSLGNGYTTATLYYSVNGGLLFTLNAAQNTVTLPTMGSATTVTFSSIDAAVNGNGINTKTVTFRLVFSGGMSNGSDPQTEIDNIQLNAAILLPEPATVWGGLLGVFGLCWLQRRRLTRFLRLRPA